MECKIFYSWQSDSTNRGFIEDVLRRVAQAIHNDDSIQVKPVIDRDAQGRNYQLFVCDVSIIKKVSVGRLTPNPNVLIELGYAIGVLGWERIVLVMNTAFGEIADLPFDLRTRRINPYILSQGAEKAYKSTGKNYYSQTQLSQY